MSTFDVTLMGTVYPNVTLERAAYADGSLALRLWDEEGPVATASVFLQGQPPSGGCVWIKDYSENEGMLDSLVRAGVVEATGRTAMAGFTCVHEARVL